MKQIITITVPNMGTYDIQIDNRQRIATTIRVLRENIGQLNTVLNSVEVRIKNSGRKIHPEQTYEEANVYTGAELILLPKAGENKKYLGEGEGNYEQESEG